MADRDPIQEATDESTDLYDIATWEPRSALDRISVAVYGGIVTGARSIIVGLAVLIIVGQLGLVWVASQREPLIGGYILLSVLPALAIAWYIWAADVTRSEPLKGLIITFVLGFLLAGFAAVLNSTFASALGALGSVFEITGAVLMVLFFYLFVAPVEEVVKWAAIRLYSYRTEDFNAVVDGAVYGAVAGLGFATIENSLYISHQFYLSASGSADALLAAFRTATVRSLAGPGHVIYSAFAGYYLGLAKFNPEHRGPIIVKGLLIAAFIHGTYNTAVTLLPGLSNAVPVLSGLPYGRVFLGFVVVYDGIFMYALYRKLARYRRHFNASDAEAAEPEEG